MLSPKGYGPGETRIAVIDGRISLVSDMLDDSHPEVREALSETTFDGYRKAVEKIPCSCCSIGRMCLANNQDRKKPVFYSGHPMAPVLVVGEAPGQEEWPAGIPFVGRSGTLLREFLTHAGFSRSQVGFHNVVMCRPADKIAGALKDRKPQPEEVNACMAHLLKVIGLVNPWIILGVGRSAAFHLFGFKRNPADAPLEDIRGIPFVMKRLVLNRNGRAFNPIGYVTYHPAACLGDRDSSGEKKTALKQDLDKMFMLFENPKSMRYMTGNETWFSKRSVAV